MECFTLPPKHKTLAIIVTYNGNQWIENCLNSYLKHHHHISDVLVVDGCSTDNTRLLVNKFADKVSRIYLDKNLGFGKANNVGLNYGLQNGYEFFFLVNQDTEFVEDVVTPMLEVASKDSSIGMLSPIHYYDVDTIEFHFKDMIKNENGAKKYESIKNKTQNIVEVKGYNAAFWFLPKRTLQQVGGFDPLFNHYGEDNEYLLRLNKSGLKAVVLTQLKALHFTKQEKRTFKTKEQFKEWFFTHSLYRWLNTENNFLSLFAYEITYPIKLLAQSIFSGNSNKLKGFLTSRNVVFSIYKQIVNHRNTNHDFRYLKPKNEQ